MKPQTDSRTRKPSWPRILHRRLPSGNVQYRIDAQVDGHRVYESFKTEADAITRAWQITDDLRRSGKAGFELPMSVRVEAAAAVAALKDYEGETIKRAVDFYIGHCLRFRNAPPVADIINEFVAEREKLNQRDRNLADVRQRLNVFARTFGTRQLAEITVEELAAWLRDPTWSARSQIHYRRRVSMLYDYGIKRRWCEVNTAALLDNPETEDKDVQCFGVEECARILEHAEEAGCLPLVVLSLFAGLRRSEVCRLQWQDVNLAERTITVGSKTAKKRSRRVVTINDACAAWLAICAQLKGPVVTIAKETLDARIKDLAAKAGLKEWKQNGLRHSFCTFHVAAYKDPVRTAYEAGNSAEIVNRCYRALASEATGKRFWALRPGKVSKDKIVIMPAPTVQAVEQAPEPAKITAANA